MLSLSVIIATWNRAHTIEKAVRTALAQSLPPLEVLVCDDGSTDNTATVITSISDPRVRWIAGPRSGLPAIPRNRGIRESKGEWLAFLDSDDEWLPDKLEKQLQLAEKQGVRAVCSNAYRLVPEKGRQGVLLQWKNNSLSFEDLLTENNVICSSTVIHRDLFSRIQGFPENPDMKAMEDYALWLRAATCTPFAFVPDTVVVYRDDSNSSIRNQGLQDPFVQQKFILEDFLKWASGQEVPASYLKTARSKYEKVLKKMSGRNEATLLASIRNIFKRGEKT